MFSYDITNSLNKAKLKYAIVGGYALALHGIVRATMDIDLVLALTEKDFKTAEAVLLTLGLKSRLPIRAEDVIKMREEYIQNRKLIAWSFVDYNNPSKVVDILITKDVRKIKTETKTVAGRKIQVATLRELLALKKAAGRPQDLVDIERIMEKLNEKTNKLKPSSKSVSPEEAIEFLDNFRKQQEQVDQPTVAISLRIPANILKTLKLKAKVNNQKYQSLIVQYIRKGLSEK